MNDPVMPPPTRLTIERMSAAELAVKAVAEWGDYAAAFLRQRSQHANTAAHRAKFREAHAMLTQPVKGEAVD